MYVNEIRRRNRRNKTLNWTLDYTNSEATSVVLWVSPGKCEMNSEANSEIALRYFCAIRKIGWNTRSNKLDRPAHFQLISKGHR